ncbi:MAG: hypothetical protein A2651_02500 [Candidatus Yanofskybacteria bacterium RIFCSPHIGHO2_01_FULL_42_12]|uniref:Uncharacterized protein n=1 Tax=Candidatus Yanofskybacteria bacterium RIFCSPLOWO2_01_FULL_42_49 TaxID=1802694 RepID=A0A1F8GCS0_9BACT|nr:MAG: hypothetical protein A2651_02500 [Candidatus Yanofskybacteria bacterium RIFCSPHIGHO2_01_FULL_42_12]OGN22546.1 MAG: hypothetical protein A2918_02175 [Candidatus Yanofskybacteria bacterium RIFCSPLOWO2_01_FULL_42_49]
MTLFYFVDLYELDKDAKQRKIATFKMQGDEPGRVEIDGDENHPVLKNIEGEGIFDYKNAKPGKLYPYDGMSFLENLKYYFRSGYLLATDVQKKAIDS